MPETLRLEDAVECGESRAALHVSAADISGSMQGERINALNGLRFKV